MMLTPVDLRNRLSRFILDSHVAREKGGMVFICVGPKSYEAGKIWANKDTGEVYIDVGRTVKSGSTE